MWGGGGQRLLARKDKHSFFTGEGGVTKGWDYNAEASLRGSKLRNCVVPESQQNGTFHIRRENSWRTFLSLSGQFSWTLLEAKPSPICSSDQSDLVSAKKKSSFMERRRPETRLCRWRFPSNGNASVPVLHLSIRT